MASVVEIKNGIIQQLPSNGASAAAAGYVGEYISTGVGGAPGATGVYKDMNSVSLTAGDWHLSFNIFIDRNNMTGIVRAYAGMGLISGNNATGILENAYAHQAFPGNPAQIWLSVPYYRLLISSTTTVYMKLMMEYTSQSNTAVYGYMLANRVR